MSLLKNKTPEAPELEEAVLGAILLQKHALFNVLELLHDELFYTQQNLIVWQAVHSLFNEGIDIDIRTVNNKIKQNGKEEIIKTLTGCAKVSIFLAKLTLNIVSSVNIESHTRILIEKAMLRGAIMASEKITKEAYTNNADAFKVIETAEKELFSLNANATKKQYVEVKTAISKVTKNIEAARNGFENSGINTGFYMLDRLLNGMRGSDLIILAARPSMGKTSLALQIARNLGIMFGKVGAFFSLETSEEKITQRLCSLESEVELKKIIKGNLNDHDYQKYLNAAKKLESINSLIIDETGAISIFELKSKAIRLKAKYNIDFIVIDYLQLMRGEKGGNREQEISSITQSLKALAKLLDIPIIALSQLSRAVETRGGDKKPQLSDLRESGSIEQDADMVMFLYRPEYYGITQTESGQSTAGVCEVIIAKNKNGERDVSCDLKFEGKFTKFYDLDETFAPEPTPTTTNNYTSFSNHKSEYTPF